MNALMQALLGTWFVVSTSFPMWLKGNKTNPTFTYSDATFNGKPALLDEVKYRQKGEVKTLTGYDTPGTADSSFVWRGKGLLSLVHSRWSVLLRDPDGQWMVICFSKTLFTPEGVDIISRGPQLPEKTLNHIKSLMADEPRMARHLADLHDLPLEPIR